MTVRRNTAVRLIGIPDIHAPYQHDDRLDQVIGDCKNADHIVLLGDVLDAYPFMSHLKNPARKHSIYEEIEVARDILSRIRGKARRASIDFIEGNHEDRLRRYIWQKAPELCDVMPSIPDLLRLEELGIRHHPQSGFVAYGARFKHGQRVRPKSGQSARSEMMRHRVSGFSGHTHRMGQAMETDAEGRTTEWWECGHLLDESKAEYVTNPDWQAGYVVVEVRNDGTLHVTPVRL